MGKKNKKAPANSLQTSAKLENTDWIILGIALVVFAVFFVQLCMGFAESIWLECDEKELKSAYEKCLYSRPDSFRAAMGQFGDAIGGLMNPLIGLITVFLFVRSLRQNQEVLRISQEELIETRNAVQQATDAQEKMEISLRKQLNLARSQNNFAKYYKHLEEFSNHVKPLVPLNAVPSVSINYRQLHRLIYPKIRSGSESASKELVRQFAQTLNGLFAWFIEPELYNENNYPLLREKIVQVQRLFRAGMINGERYSLYVYNESFTTYFIDIENYSFGDVIKSLASEVKLFANILEFSYEPVAVESMIMVANCLEIAAKNAPTYIYSMATQSYHRHGDLDSIISFQRAQNELQNLLDELRDK